MINIRSSEEQVVANIKKYIGVGNFKVVGINCTLDELEKLGFNYQKEPQYKVELGGKQYSKVVFYVRNEKLDIQNKLEFLISNEEVVFSTGSKKFVNDLAQSSVGASLEAVLARTNDKGVSFFKNVNARAAKNGEVEILEFLVAWFNIKNFVSKKEADAKIQPDTVQINFAALVDGNVSELRKYHAVAKDNEVKLLLHEDKGYVNVYNRYFDRATANLNNFAKYITKQEADGYPPKGNYVVADLQEYIESVSSPKPNIDTPVVTAGDVF
jgi:hypothetical protein